MIEHRAMSTVLNETSDGVDGSVVAEMTRTRSSFLRRVRAHEPQAWGEFVDLYGPLVFAWCRRSGLDSPDAADVTQDVFIAVDRAIGRFESGGVEGALRGWLCTITHNKIRDLHRKRGRQFPAAGGTTMQVRLNELPDPLSESIVGVPGGNPISSLYRRALCMVREEVAENTWQAFWRATVEQQETSAIAEELGMTPNGVRQAKSRVLRRLRERLCDGPD